MSEKDVIPQPSGGWSPPWPRVWELAETLPHDRWALVGGLMVQAHAMAARVETTRVTVDVDVAARVEAGVFSYSSAASALLESGYTLDETTTRAYRFRRGTDVVDLMAPDHERPPPRFGRKLVLQIDGGQQALNRTEVLQFDAGDRNVAVPVPTLHGALVLKAAAHLVDSRDRDRHLLDSMTLLACITDTAPILADLRGSDRSRLTHVLDSLAGNGLIEAQAPADTAALARRTADDLRRGLAQ